MLDETGSKAAQTAPGFWSHGSKCRLRGGDRPQDRDAARAELFAAGGVREWECIEPLRELAQGPVVPGRTLATVRAVVVLRDEDDRHERVHFAHPPFERFTELEPFRLRRR